MKLIARLLPVFPLLVYSISAGATLDSAKVRALFRKPPTEYSTGPLWVWNDMLTEQQIRESLQELASQKVKQVWVHPRPGLMTPYLGEDWFRLWKVALKEAERLDMNVWIYDENSYPSGFAGGLVPEAMPESRGRGLELKEMTNAPSGSESIVAVYRLGDHTNENVTARVKAGEKLPEGRYLVGTELRTANRAWTANRCYVNLLSPGVTEKFLEVTMEPYRREIGKHFGKRVPGVFTDEPHLRPAGGFPWSETLAADFKQRWGYDLMDHLPSLVRPVGDWRKIRHNYFQLLHELFVERWAKPNFNYCKTNHLEWTGHYWEHTWPDALSVPDSMAMYAWHQRPAIDCLMNQYKEDTHAQFGNVRMVKELSSVANQVGWERTLCEIYGAGGWDLRFEDMKRIGDWLEVLGVNTLNQHLTYVTIRGARKRDHPQSFSYHAPWWRDYHVSAEYFARLSAALSQGEQVNRVLVLEPTTTAWMYQGDPARLDQISDLFCKLLYALEAAQVEYDIGCEDIIANYGAPGSQKRVEDGKEICTTLKVGRREYQTLIIPPFTENLNRKTKALLDQVSIPVQRLGPAPPRVEGEGNSDQFEPAMQAVVTNFASWCQTVANDARAALKKEGFSIDRRPNDKGNLFHMRRKLSDGEVLFLVNTSIEHSSAGSLLSSFKGVEAWDLYSGATLPYPCISSAEGITARFDLPPCGSLLLLLTPEPGVRDLPAENVITLAPTDPVEVRRKEPNVLTLDYVDVTAGGQAKTNVYFYEANDFVWKQHGLDHNPWDSAVQFKDELISKKFPVGSGFEASYRFTIEGGVPTNLAIVIERADLYQISCNGKPVRAKPGNWWLDRAFGRIGLTSCARSGENVVTVKASPMTMFHELEPAYVLGEFSLKPKTNGFAIAQDRHLEVRANRTGWNQQGHPFYSAGVSYSEKFKVEKNSGRYVVSMPNWFGSVARVSVNGKPAGYIDAAPWECEVTRRIQHGENTIEVTIIGTPKNLLGPHHGEPKLGAAWPAAFRKGPASGPPPGESYSTVSYGLFEPFVLKRISVD